MLDTPMGIAYIGGRLYIADSGNKRIRRVTECSFYPQMMPFSASFSASGGTGGFEVVTDDGCGWAAHSNADWIIVTKGAGSGRGTVFFSFKDNPQSAARTGSISVSENFFQINQDAARPTTGTFEPQLVKHLTPGFYIVA